MSSLTAPASEIAPVIGQNIIPTTCAGQKCNNRGKPCADDAKAATRILKKTYVPPSEWPQNRQGRASYGGSTQPKEDFILTIPRNAKPTLLQQTCSLFFKQSEAHLRSVTWSLFCLVYHKAKFWGRDCAGSVLQCGRAFKCFRFAHFRSYIVESRVDTGRYDSNLVPFMCLPLIQRRQNLRHTGWYRAAFTSAWGISTAMSSSFVAQNASVCMSSVIDMSFSSSKTCILCIAVLQFYQAGQMHQLFQRKFSCNSVMIPSTALRVISSCSSSLHLQISSGEDVLSAKKTELFRTLFLTLRLSPKTSATTVKTLRGKYRPACLKNIWKKLLSAYELQR